MIRNPPPCPRASRTAELARQPLQDADAEQLAAHLEECPDCASRVEDLLRGDAMEVALRGATGPDAPTPLPGDSELIERLKSLVGPGAATVTAPLEPANVVSGRAATGAAGAQRTQHDDEDKQSWDFLAPPQQPDELGRLGPYRILALLGKGGMGVVFRAEDPQLQRLVALKAMLPALAASGGAKQRFLREARSAAAIKHDHIVSIHQVGEDRGVPFVAMELLEGESLDERLQRDGKLPLAETLRIGREIAEGLAAAHERGLIHRDIKPANIWLEKTRRAPAGRVKILDFGLARAGDDSSQLTQEGAIVGTPAYMAPEQARGETLHARCDLFSLGVVLYRMGTGKMPFVGKDTVSTLLSVAVEQPPPPVKLTADVPQAFSNLVMALLEKDPARRTSSAGEVVQALQSIEAQSARPEQRLPVAAERRWLRVAVASAALVGLIVAGVVLLWQNPSGTVRIEINDPEIAFAIDNDALKIGGPDQEQPIIIAPGEHTLRVQRGNLQFTSSTFVLKKGETVTLKVELLPGKLQVVQGGRVIGEGKLAGTPPSLDRAEYSLDCPRANDNVTVPTLEFDLGGPRTIEGYITPYTRYTQSATKDPPVAHNALCVWNGNRKGSPFLLCIHAAFNIWSFQFTSDDQSEKAVTSAIPMIVGKRTHVALVFTGRQFRLFIDGALSATRDVSDLSFGKRKGALTLGHYFIGRIAEVRLSKAARYDKDFTPAQRFEPDADTLALYHCDEGQGDVLKDYSGNAHHGKIVAARWVKGPPPAIAPFDGTLAKARQAAWAKYLGTTVESTNSVGMKMMVIPPGEFLMGSTDEQLEAALKAAEKMLVPGEKESTSRAERPQHRVVITRPFWMSATEVTVGQFKRFAATGYRTEAEQAGDAKTYLKPGWENTDDLPASLVTWKDATAYCKWLSELEKANYRLPTEAEWEYACRAGTTTQYSFGDDPALLHRYATFYTSKGPAPVATKLPNPFGFYDMHGNVFEWCQDRFVDDWYQKSPVEDPCVVTDAVAFRVIRGGHWYFNAHFCRSAHRTSYPESLRSHHHNGFRIVRVLDAPEANVLARATPAPSQEAARQQYALECSPSGRNVRFPSLQLDLRGPRTIEGYITPQRESEASHSVLYAFNNVVAIPRFYAPMFFSIHTSSNKWAFNYADDKKAKAVFSLIPMTVGKKTHVALVFTGREFRLFIDGALAVAQDASDSTFDIRKGDFSLGHRWTGQISEVRISKVARYDKDFTPAQRFDNDADTLALYHFDEGQGAVLRDSSGNGHHGQIVNAKWVKADETSTVPSNVGATK